MRDSNIDALIEREINSLTVDLSKRSTMEVLKTINAYDKTVAESIEQHLPSVEKAVDAICMQLLNGGRIFYVGAGTSGRLAVLDSAECPPTFGTNPELVQSIIAGGLDAMLAAVEDVEDDEGMSIKNLKERNLESKDVVIGISASGRTPFSLSALEYANQLGCLTIAICTRGPSPMEKEAHIAIAPDVGAEVLNGSSRMKSGTAQKMLLGMLSTTVMIRLGKVYNNQMIDLVANNEKLIYRAENIVASTCHIPLAEAKAFLEKAEYRPRAAALMCLGNISYQQALTCIQNEFQTLEEQLLIAKQNYDQ
ncbi:N-acetylmuramic acid 6-phosphate etherase [Vibrio nigripulchritudo SFn27]|uniref:N-acetylmuramic acid 6-phosphate etherase n=1 Tax=Vibrio nigripulchritudo TaxID=28173 RepID=U4KG76_9VIBR|nr:N-acetylmuramic acid 6-phosphate etherase [Vibrio nigripulchritudo]CCN84883.1 N-acetylmuramic acid 6-phosphate etherase [Vibrio nigripulchritudo BLFn1]CCN90095.1 N-acetylmuramic acid 6-phosphate etherase [Vibrio nigripulchritudo SFn27]CCN94292.1 N-acetylmuramic acid 6-phosphate etherase [Vibrio nigripulchritudo ENn2]CCO42646.1 N-acetylmuramic acid 6-phosphate etherase [Vibrio nigripulchritudo SFn135]CCO51250.1 N-acetylmuramic acid 6-phosphate etherase [Vibrio nigripulchritudo Wn13]